MRVCLCVCVSVSECVCVCVSLRSRRAFGCRCKSNSCVARLPPSPPPPSRVLFGCIPGRVFYCAVRGLERTNFSHKSPLKQENREGARFGQIYWNSFILKLCRGDYFPSLLSFFPSWQCSQGSALIGMAKHTDTHTRKHRLEHICKCKRTHPPPFVRWWCAGVCLSC